IDNASTDNTYQVARDLWPGDSPVPLRVYQHFEAGVGRARWRGLEEARYEYVIFVDDDNWLAPDYIRLASEIMSDSPDVAACGGFGEIVTDIEPPSWMRRFESLYAVGGQAASKEKASETLLLRGAGLTVRRTAVLNLYAAGFAPLLIGRTPESLVCGSDTELCY